MLCTALKRFCLRLQFILARNSNLCFCWKLPSHFIEPRRCGSRPKWMRVLFGGMKYGWTGNEHEIHFKSIFLPFKFSNRMRKREILCACIYYFIICFCFVWMEPITNATLDIFASVLCVTITKLGVGKWNIKGGCVCCLGSLAVLRCAVRGAQCHLTHDRHCFVSPMWLA